MIKVKFEEFFNNPMGKGSTVLNLKASKADYDKKYDGICKNISHQVYIINNDIYIHVKIPSSVEGIFYDVVFKFKSTASSPGKNINDMEFQVFSNSPSFIYTYANSYHSRKMLIKELNKKLSKEMLKKMAETKNPYNVISYDSTLYMAMKYIIVNGYTKVDELKEIAKKCSIGDFLKNIQDWDTIQKNRKIQKDFAKLIAKQELEDKKRNITNSNTPREQSMTQVKKVKNVKNNKKVGIIKMGKQVKKIKSSKKK